MLLFSNPAFQFRSHFWEISPFTVFTSPVVLVATMSNGSVSRRHSHKRAQMKDSHIALESAAYADERHVMDHESDVADIVAELNRCPMKVKRCRDAVLGKQFLPMSVLTESFADGCTTIGDISKTDSEEYVGKYITLPAGVTLKKLAKHDRLVCNKLIIWVTMKSKNSILPSPKKAETWKYFDDETVLGKMRWDHVVFGTDAEGHPTVDWTKMGGVYTLLPTMPGDHVGKWVYETVRCNGCGGITASFATSGLAVDNGWTVKNPWDLKLATLSSPAGKFQVNKSIHHIFDDFPFYKRMLERATSKTFKPAVAAAGASASSGTAAPAPTVAAAADAAVTTPRKKRAALTTEQVDAIKRCRGGAVQP